MLIVCDIVDLNTSLSSNNLDSGESQYQNSNFIYIAFALLISFFVISIILLILNVFLFVPGDKVFVKLNISDGRAKLFFKWKYHKSEKFEFQFIDSSGRRLHISDPLIKDTEKFDEFIKNPQISKFYNNNIADIVTSEHDAEVFDDVGEIIGRNSKQDSGKSLSMEDFKNITDYEDRVKIVDFINILIFLWKFEKFKESSNVLNANFFEYSEQQERPYSNNNTQSENNNQDNDLSSDGENDNNDNNGNNGNNPRNNKSNEDGKYPGRKPLDLKINNREQIGTYLNPIQAQSHESEEFDKSLELDAKRRKEMDELLNSLPTRKINTDPVEEPVEQKIDIDPVEEPVEQDKENGEVDNLIKANVVHIAPESKVIEDEVSDLKVEYEIVKDDNRSLPCGFSFKIGGETFSIMGKDIESAEDIGELFSIADHLHDSKHESIDKIEDEEIKKLLIKFIQIAKDKNLKK